MTLGDFFYVLFRHKRKIVVISVLGAVTALILPFVTPRLYESEAKLFIRYVLESKSPGQLGANDSRIKSPDERGENIINTELEILTSLDLAQEVVSNLGPQRILSKAGGGTDYYQAVGLIHKNLLVEVPKKSNVIRILFQHPDPEIVRPVLNDLIAIYFKRHAEIHRSVGAFDGFLVQETDKLRARLVETERELRRAKTDAGILSLDDSKKAHSEQIAKIRQEIFDAEAELAERQAAANEMAKLLHTQSMADTNQATATNDVAAPVAKIVEYRRVSALLDFLEKKDQEQSVEFTATVSRVKEVREQIAEAEKLKTQLEEENPALLAVKLSETKNVTAAQDSSPRTDFLAEMARVTALQSKIRVLNDQLESIRKEATTVEEAEGSILELQRKKELEEANYKYFSQSLEQSQIDEALGAGRVSNISEIQAPSPPTRAASKLRKTMAMALFGGVFGAFALAFLIEFFLDQTLKRPKEIETTLGLPLFLSIPLMSRNGKPQLLNGASRAPLLSQSTGVEEKRDPVLEGDDSSPQLTAGAANGNGTHVGTMHTFGAFSGALRDRLIAYFEIKKLTHKPKLVGLTSCAGGSGVSTIAVGLAASLSETGDGNVLLVDMNFQGTAHQFYKGTLACGLDDALALEKRSNALVQDNLYVVSAGSNQDNLPRALPKRFSHLVPKLKCSDYDYIIFDLPPVSQISPTDRLSRFMDMMLLVIESEKTDREVVKAAAILLSESKANIGVILNKSRTYVPRRLHQEL
jgi:succinoglycan biosynthesis transport protein ExoP